MQLEDSTEVQHTGSTQETATTQEDIGSLAAGFAKVRGGESHTEAATSALNAAASASVAANADIVNEESSGEPSTEVKAEATAEVSSNEVTEEETIPGLGMKASEVKAILAKAAEFDQLKEHMAQESRKMYGKFGDIQKKINSFQSQPSGQSVKVTKDALKRTLTDYPELAESLADDLSEILKSPASGFDQAQVDSLVTERLSAELARINQENERKLLTIAHRDWRDVIRSDDYTIWKGTLPADKRQTLDASWDAVTLSDFITEYKGWKAEAATKAETTKQRRAEKLANAVVPNGVAAAGPVKVPDHKGLSAGFARVRKAHL